METVPGAVLSLLFSFIDFPITQMQTKPIRSFIYL